MTAPAWYVVQTAPSAETRITRRLEAKNFEIYFPRTRRLVVHKGIARPIVQPRLPGYLFAHFDPQRDAVEYITEEDDVVRVLGNGGPEPVNHGFVERWISDAPDGVFNEVPPPAGRKPRYILNYQVYSWISISAGSYASLPGMVLQWDEDKVQVDLALFQQENKVWIEHGCVEGAVLAQCEADNSAVTAEAFNRYDHSVRRSARR